MEVLKTTEEHGKGVTNVEIINAVVTNKNKKRKGK